MAKFIRLKELKGTCPKDFSIGKTICIQKCRISYFESAYDMSDCDELQKIKDDDLRKQALSTSNIGSHIVLIDTKDGQPKEFFVVEHPNLILSIIQN